MKTVEVYVIGILDVEVPPAWKEAEFGIGVRVGELVLDITAGPHGEIVITRSSSTSAPITVRPNNFNRITLLP